MARTVVFALRRAVAAHQRAAIGGENSFAAGVGPSFLKVHLLQNQDLAPTKPSSTLRCFSSSPERNVVSLKDKPVPDEASDEDTTEQSTTPTLPPRNRSLADALRSGLKHLNQNALDIQNEIETRRSLFKEEKIVSPRDMRAKNNERRLLKTAQRCVEELAQTKSILRVHGDPILLLELTMSGHRMATVYWSLPISVLMKKDMPHIEKQYLEFKMHQQITEEGAGQLLSTECHNRMLKYQGFPARVQLKPAKDKQIMELMSRYSEMMEAEENAEEEEADEDAEEEL
uniref:Uncharacterized protein n=1 Tax=Entomoneis paludosa TaxID=265537 RepID=A0A7S2Y9C0_9STRA|mmetsp:Transcript_23500/g.48789  ORF Transcript_23500/g.48789 Transcript_23500/m.48789 type:complete len:286 (+) Transcript_23500:84-941(+)